MVVLPFIVLTHTTFDWKIQRNFVLERILSYSPASGMNPLDPIRKPAKRALIKVLFCAESVFSVSCACTFYNVPVL